METNQFNQLKICKISNKKKDKERRIDRVVYKGLNHARIERNEVFLRDIDDRLPARIDTHKLFSMGHEQRLNFMNTLSKPNRDEIDYLIHSLFM